jgi:hypothetical protein
VLIDDQGNAPALAVRSTPRDQYPRRVAYSRAPKNDKTPVGNTAAAGVPTPEGQQTRAEANMHNKHSFLF